ncbi:glycosyltransferase family 2 protein [uncultured Enterococcus sp.]|uniref:glycosyltransferase family 2 protein n=1 Tax=uncultured Enterococcus sp. TaxID=167972 RepID=UPI0026283572|nr:glycosyltransferase family 2 protein [uncultured Enterococcus sp.]
MRSGELISVIVPVYNVADYLEQCLDSILNQTYKEFEVILVDDGSTDTSYSICDEYVKRDSRFHLFRQENKGLSAARNAGLELCEGGYITFVDSDDFVSPEYLQGMIENLKQADADIAICEHYRLENGTFYFQKHDLNDREIISSRDAFKRIHQVNYAVAWGKLFKSSLFRYVRFPVGRVYEDSFTLPKLYMFCEKIVVLPDELYCYRQRSTSIINSQYSFEKIADHLAVYEEMIMDLSLANENVELTKMHYISVLKKYKMWFEERKLTKHELYLRVCLRLLMLEM